MPECERCKALERVMRGECRCCKHIKNKSDEPLCSYYTLPDWEKWELEMNYVQIGIAEKEKGNPVSVKTILSGLGG